MSAPVFRLKGGGWYETDFKSDKENKRNLVGADKEEPKADAKADKDSKPEAKADKDAKPAETKTPAAEPARRAPRSSSAAKGGRAARKPARSGRRRSARRGRR